MFREHFWFIYIESLREISISLQQDDIELLDIQRKAKSSYLVMAYL